MRRTAIVILLGAASIGLGACGESARDNAAAGGNEAAGAEGAAAAGTNGSVPLTANAAWPKGSKIVVEDNVTYRVDADGTRVALGPTDSRIVVENEVRYRVDPDGTRVRIDPEGVALDVDLPDVTPDVDVGINEKGNPDIDVKGDKDGDEKPN